MLGIGEAASIIKRRKTLSVMLTFACPAQCENCGTISSPRDRHNLSLNCVLRGIDEARQLDFENVVFTGGEATLRWDDLLTAIRYANDAGLPTRLVTNAHWAESVDKASVRLDELLRAGLKEINFSTGDEHVRFIPLDRVVFAIIATIEQGLIAHVMVELRSMRKVTKHVLMEHPLIRCLPSTKLELLRPTESPWMPLRPEQIETYPDRITSTKSNLSRCGGCDNVLQTYVLQADSRVGACCGLGMRAIPELSVADTGMTSFLATAIRTAESDILKLWIHYSGPEKILAWAAGRDPSIKWEGMYGHRCQACIRLYKDRAIQAVILECYTDAIPELLQTAWLREHYIPSKLAISRDSQKS